ncbi:MAG: hypothetical protein V7L13_31550 [Nostoc sp.]
MEARNASQLVPPAVISLTRAQAMPAAVYYALSNFPLYETLNAIA